MLKKYRGIIFRVEWVGFTGELGILMRMKEFARIEAIWNNEKLAGGSSCARIVRESLDKALSWEFWMKNRIDLTRRAHTKQSLVSLGWSIMILRQFDRSAVLRSILN